MGLQISSFCGAKALTGVLASFPPAILSESLTVRISIASAFLMRMLGQPLRNRVGVLVLKKQKQLACVKEILMAIARAIALATVIAAIRRILTASNNHSHGSSSSDGNDSGSRGGAEQ